MPICKPLNSEDRLIFYHHFKVDPNIILFLMIKKLLQQNFQRFAQLTNREALNQALDEELAAN